MHRVLTIAETLREILSRLEREQLTPCAMVCTTWAEVARDFIWASVEEPCELFRLLVPLGVVKFTHKFTHEPTLHEWEAFRDTYARRVRYICMHELLEIVYAERPRWVILPNLQTLRVVWDDGFDVKFILPFMHHGLSTLVIDVEMEQQDFASRCTPLAIDALSRYAPNLKTLKIESVISSPSPQIIPLLSSFTNLYEIVLPPFRANRACFQAISRVNNLHSLVFSDSPSKHWRYINNISQPTSSRADLLEGIHIDSGSFRSLCRLSILAPMAEIIYLLSRQHFPLSRLEALSCYTLKPGDSSQLYGFLSLLARGTLALEELILGFAPSGRRKTLYNTSMLAMCRAVAPITYNDLRPLRDLRILQKFHIHHSHPLVLGTADLEDMASNLRALTSIYLNADPLFDEGGSQLTVDVLPALATHLLNLNTLGLYVNTDGFSTSLYTPSRSGPRFRHLSRLDLGRTKLMSPLMRRNLAFAICTHLPLRAGRIDLLRWGASALKEGFLKGAELEERLDLLTELEGMLRVAHSVAEEKDECRSIGSRTTLAHPDDGYWLHEAFCP